MADRDNATTQETNFLDMSDEEMANFDPSSLQSSTTEVDENLDQNTEVVDEGNSDSTGTTDAGDANTDGVNDDNTDTDTGNTDATGDDNVEVVDEVTDKTDKTPAEVSDPAKTEATAEVAEPVDYKAVVDKLFTPFKANGRDIQVKNVDDAIALMQMGANYNKKMAGLKPNLRLMKMLEANGLLNEEKLSFLIDLEKKNPEAINKLVKDSGMDPLDLSAEKASEYKPGTYKVDEREMQLDEVLSEIESSPAYARTLEVVSNKWDGASKGVIAANPELLKVINSHVETGIYDQITAEIEHERTFGRLNGLSDIEAYRQVGDAIQARGGFAHLGHQKQTIPNTPVVVQPKPKKVDDEKLRDQKRAASSTKTVAPSSTAKMDFNPLALSDEDFLKQANPKFL